MGVLKVTRKNPLTKYNSGRILTSMTDPAGSILNLTYGYVTQIKRFAEAVRGELGIKEGSQ